MSTQEIQKTTANKDEDENSNESEVKVLLQSLLDDSAQLHNMYKSWNNTLRRLAKEMDREQKKLVKTKPKRHVKQKPQEVTKEMQKFMKQHSGELGEGIQHGTSYTRQVMMKAVSRYIKEKNLQNPENKKQWKSDNALKPLFTLEKDWYTFMQINGLLSRVVVNK